MAWMFPWRKLNCLRAMQISRWNPKLSSFQDVTSHGGKLRYFQRRQFKQCLNREANLHQAPFFQNVMRQAKSLLQNKEVHVLSFIHFSSKWVTNTLSEVTHTSLKGTWVENAFDLKFHVWFSTGTEWSQTNYI